MILRMILNIMSSGPLRFSCRFIRTRKKTFPPHLVRHFVLVLESGHAEWWSIAPGWNSTPRPRVGDALTDENNQTPRNKLTYLNMDLTADRIWADFRTLRESTPLVLSLTNSVVREFTANALLALGASPIMSDAFEEIAELVGISNVLNLNIGTPTPRSAEAMALAAGVAKAKSIPIALDPVAVGATKLRRELVDRLLRIATPTVIRGNQAEIAALAGLSSGARGVDAVGNLDQASAVVRQLAKELATIVVASGATDYLSDGEIVIT